MRRALGADQLVRGRLVAVGLHALLQKRLGVCRMLGTLGSQMRLERTVDKLRRGIPAGVQIQRAHERLVDVLERRVQAARAGTGLGGTKDDDVIDTQLVRHLGQRGARDKGHLQARELALVKLRIGHKQGACDNGAQNGITQELKALVACRDWLAFDGRRMRKGRAQQHLVIELVAQNLLGARKSFG